MAKKGSSLNPRTPNREGDGKRVNTWQRARPGLSSKARVVYYRADRFRTGRRRLERRRQSGSTTGGNTVSLCLCSPSLEEREEPVHCTERAQETAPLLLLPTHFGNPAGMSLMGFRPVALRPHLSVGLPFSEVLLIHCKHGTVCLQ
jgi:hypothetical protein